MVPVGAQPHEFVVEVDADAPAHAHHHGLAVHGVETGLVVLDDVGRYLADPSCGAHDCFKLGPLGLELLLALDLLAFGDLLEVVVDVGPPTVVQGQAGQAALVVDGHGRHVLHGALDVVDADVVAEHGPGVGVLLLDGGAGEADEGSVGQGVAHVGRVAVDEVVLAAMGFIGDHDDVAPARQPGVEGHGEALAGALRVPDDTDTAITRLVARPATGIAGPARSLL